jgi:hypothetical protein
VFNNSANNCGTQINGASGSYTVDPSQYFNFVSGTYCSGAGNNQMNPVQQTSPVPYPPNFNIPAPSISCGGTGSSSYNSGTNTWTYTPGNYPSGGNLNHAGDVIFQPGNYCFGNSFKVNGFAHVIANDVKLKITGGEFSLNGGSTLTCNNFLVHINGGNGMRFNGNSAVYCNDVTFFASTGDVSWAGNVGIRLKAPKGGDYKGLLIYMPYGNNSQLTINGNSSNELVGSIIAVSSDISIAGNSGTNGLHTQIIGYTVTLQGHSNTVINYNPDEQWAPPDPSILALTK